MDSKIVFYVVRHGKTILNTLNRVQGWSDSPLTDEGIKVAENLGIGLRDIKFSSVYTSDLRRTRQTAQLILQKQGQEGLEINEKEEFREVCFGSYESDIVENMWRDVSLYMQYAVKEKLLEDIFNQDKEITFEQAVNTVKVLDQLGIAEDFKQVESRMQKTLLEISKKESAQQKEANILIVAHGMCITFMLQNLGGRELLKESLDNASVCKVIFENEKLQVETMGDMSYVLKGKEQMNKSQI